MNKTVHKTIIHKSFTAYTTAPTSHKNYLTHAECTNMKLFLQTAATDLLQPRSEAVAHLLAKARNN